MTATSLTDTQGIIAIAAAAVAVVALVGCVALTLSVRRLRAAQRVVLGEGKRDVVAHAAALQGGFEDLREYVGEVAERLDERLTAAEAGLGGAIAHRALVRYDAYNESVGTSVGVDRAARRDALGSRAVLYPPPRPGARVRQAGPRRSQRAELSPEEEQAVQLALSPAGEDVVVSEQRSA